MTVNLFSYTDVENKINKALENELEIKNVFIKNQVFNIDNFDIVFKFNGDVNAIFSHNYCYIEKLKRYYFIKNIEIKNNDTYSIELEIDVLMSFKDSILNSNCHIVESEKTENIKDVSNLDRYEIKKIGLDTSDFFNPLGFNFLLCENRNVI